jgi:ribonuclease HI
MRFKGEVVWVRADDTGNLVTDGSGRAEMKYRETDDKSYRPFAGNLSPDEGGAAPAAARPAATRARRSAAAATLPRATNGSGLSPSAGGALELWTDGACSGNPGPMGIGVVAIDGTKRREVSEYLGVGTNNIAELTAIERALDTADIATGNDRGRRMRIYTDSAYAIGVLSKAWKAKANQELIARIKRRLVAYPNVEFVKVSGHAGIPENERCDALARAAVDRRA